MDPEELFRNIFGDNFNFRNFAESEDYESSQYGFAQAAEVCELLYNLWQERVSNIYKFKSITNMCVVGL